MVFGLGGSSNRDTHRRARVSVHLSVASNFTRNPRCCFNKGNCKVALSLDRDTVDITAGVLPLFATVTNDTNLTIKSLVVSIEQDLILHIPYNTHGPPFQARPQLVFSKNVDAIVAPHSMKEAIQLPVSMAEYSHAFRKNARKKKNTGAPNRVELVPTWDILYASVRFRVVVRVNFGTRLATVVKADLPITLLNISDPSVVPPAVPVASIPADPAASGTTVELGAVQLVGPDKVHPSEAAQAHVSSPVPVSRV